jgi:hypothetical protein
MYFNQGQSRDQAAANFVATLLHQLAQQTQDLSGTIAASYERHKEANSLPSIGECSSMLTSEVDRFAKVYVVIDALDECEDQTRLTFLSALNRLQRTNQHVYLLVSSRQIDIIRNDLESPVELEVTAMDEDIDRYVEGQLTSKVRLRNLIRSHRDLEEKVKETVKQKAEGM